LLALPPPFAPILPASAFLFRFSAILGLVPSWRLDRRRGARGVGRGWGEWAGSAALWRCSPFIPSRLRRLLPRPSPTLDFWSGWRLVRARTAPREGQGRDVGWWRLSSACVPPLLPVSALSRPPFHPGLDLGFVRSLWLVWGSRVVVQARGGVCCGVLGPSPFRPAFLPDGVLLSGQIGVLDTVEAV
jgi:hypothetical protein